MKKVYISPQTHTVNVRLIGYVMEGGQGYGQYSHVAGGGDDPGFGGGKENDFDIDEGGFSPDLWAEEEEDY